MNHCGSRSYKDSTKIIKPKSEWILHEGLHDAIIPTEVWEAVQVINETARHHADGRAAPTPKLFSNKLVCVDCKCPLRATTETHRRKNGAVKRYVSYLCSTFTKSGRSVCSGHRIYEQTLAQIILAEIKAHAQSVTLDEATVVDRLKRQIAQHNAEGPSAAQQEIRQLRRRTEELESLIAKLYEDVCCKG